MMSVSFGVRQFRRLLAGCLLVNVCTFLSSMTGNALAGWCLGEQGLAGVALAAPLMSVSNFLFSLIGIGLGINYSLRMGALDRDGAESVFMQGVWLSLIVGFALAFGAFILREPYFAFMGAGPVAVVHAREYWLLFPVGLLFMFLTNVVLVCNYCDGDVGLATAGVVGQIVISPFVGVLAFRLVPGLGALAFSLGLTAGYVFSFLLLCGHFLRTCNTFSFAWRFCPADAWAVIRSSAGDAVGFLSDALVFGLLGMVTTRLFGSCALVVYPAFVFVCGLADYSDGVASAMQPILGVYIGEGNHRSARVVAHFVFGLLTVVSLAFTVVLLLFPEIVVRAIGITDAAYVPSAELVVRMTALALLPDTLLNLSNNYYQQIGHVTLSVAMSAVCCGLLRIAAILIFSTFGTGVFWCWYAVANWGGVLLLALALLFEYGRRRFPWLLDSAREAAICNFELKLRKEKIVATAEAVAQCMRRFGVDQGRAMKARLLIEETLMVVRDRNEGKDVFAEVTLDFNDGVVITLRYDGVIFDITDADAKVNGLGAYLVATMMQHHSERFNILTTGFNRNVFRF